MRIHRTTARGAFLLILLLALGLAVAGAALALNEPLDPEPQAGKQIVFPIVGAAEYFDDWGAPRGQGRHAGNDILTTWRSPAVAAEDGKIKLWTTSARAGCMLYLYGASGTTYLYIHLNNDLTAKRDNRGKCVPGVAYATGLKNGARVKAGQLIAYNGDSGDAEGTYHLHFEVHPKGGVDVDPHPYLDEARRLLFPLPARPARQVKLGLKGAVVAAGGGVVEMSVTGVRVWPGGAWTALPARSVVLSVPTEAVLDASLVDLLTSPTRRTLSSRNVTKVLAFTIKTAATPAVMSGEPEALSVDRIRPG
jgi:hypothetical protein